MSTRRQITLRQIPDRLDRQLRRLAQETHSSLNKTIISLLLKALGMSDDSKKMRDLSDLAGKWDDAEAEQFERNTEIFNRIDNEIWE